MTKLAERIRSFRVKNRLTREQVISILAIPLDDYIALEEGRMEPSEQFIKDMIALWGCDRETLLPKPAEISELKLFHNVGIGEEGET